MSVSLRPRLLSRARLVVFLVVGASALSASCSPRLDDARDPLPTLRAHLATERAALDGAVGHEALRRCSRVRVLLDRMEAHTGEPPTAEEAECRGALPQRVLAEALRDVAAATAEGRVRDTVLACSVALHALQLLGEDDLDASRCTSSETLAADE
jgi:hypothetical protein